MHETQVFGRLASDDLTVRSPTFHHLSRRVAFFLIVTANLTLWLAVAAGVLYFA
jgi:hypothetical protein